MLEFREMVIDLGNLWRATTRSLLRVGDRPAKPVSALILSWTRPNKTNCCARRRFSIRERNGNLGARRVHCLGHSPALLRGVIMRDPTRAMQMGPIAGHDHRLEIVQLCFSPHRRTGCIKRCA
jgi:hypothetical protein